MEPTVLLAVALALALGFVLGALAGARQAWRLARSYRGASEGMLSFLPGAMPTRTAADVLAGRVRVRFGTTEYSLPVPSMDDSDRWVAELDAKWGSLPDALRLAENDLEKAIKLLQAHTGAMLDAVIAFDQTGVLPAKAELRKVATAAQILHAVSECWLAANPLAASIAGSMEPPTMDGTPPEAPSTSLTHTVGASNTGSG